MIYESLGTNLEHHKHLGCCPSITIDKHPCDALLIRHYPYLFILIFCWYKGTDISAFIQEFIVKNANIDNWGLYL